MNQRWLTALVCLSSIAFGASCVPMGGSGSGGGGGGGVCAGDMGATGDAARIEAFLAATSAYAQAADQLHTETFAACRRMGVALGMNNAELQGSSSQDMQRVCSAVNQKYRAEMQLVQQAHIQVNIMAQPPQCQVSVDAYARCAAECQATVTPGYAEIHCEGGEIRGQCSAQCTGSCAVDVHASCSGTCEGACDGQCSARNADGSCAGQCNGTCNGQCVARAQASCQGECRGGCSVEYTQPYCTGQVRPPQVEAECQASCDARIEAEASCQPGQLTMNVSGVTDGEMRARLDRLRNATRDGLSAIYTLRVRAQRLATSGAEVVRRAPGAAQSAIRLGAQAASCAAAAASASARAMAQVNVSVQVSVEVSASASASASGG